MKTASLLTLASCAAAQLYVGSRVRNKHQDTNRVSATGDESQLSLSDPVAQFTDYSSSKYLDKSPIKTGLFTKSPQDNTTCATYGESQWTGTVDVTATRRLFYWAFESRNDPVNDPVIFWLNGGPGSTSTTGLFIEMGPCWLPVNETVTEPNPWSWNNNATVVFLEQPAGVGLSVLAPGAKSSTNDQGGAEDFQTFLNIFYQEVFPEKKNLPIILSAESYGGHYGPTYLNHILESRRYNAANAFRGNITGLILVDALLEFSGMAIGQYELLCETEHAKGIINETACENMALALPEVERLHRICTVGGSGAECFAAMAYADAHVTNYYGEKVAAGERSPFSIHRPCIDGEYCPDLTKGNTTKYLNQPHIKEALHLSPDFEFVEVYEELNTAYSDSNDIFKSTMPLVGNVLDAHRAKTLDEKSSLGDIKVLVLNGNDDAVVNSAGNKWLYDHLPWSGFAQYRTAKWRELEDVGVTGDWKATRDGRLAFVAVDEAGHMVPGDQREGSFRILKKWMQGEYHF